MRRKAMLNKSRLTGDTLDRFEKEFDLSLLTDCEKRNVEHSAFAANMGAKSEEDAWDWFLHVVTDVYHIHLKEKEY
jgi:hypothetical protein